MGTAPQKIPAASRREAIAEVGRCLTNEDLVSKEVVDLLQEGFWVSEVLDVGLLHILHQDVQVVDSITIVLVSASCIAGITVGSLLSCLHCAAERHLFCYHISRAPNLHDYSLKLIWKSTYWVCAI